MIYDALPHPGGKFEPANEELELNKDTGADNILNGEAVATATPPETPMDPDVVKHLREEVDSLFDGTDIEPLALPSLEEDESFFVYPNPPKPSFFQSSRERARTIRHHSLGFTRPKLRVMANEALLHGGLSIPLPRLRKEQAELTHVVISDHSDHEWYVTHDETLAKVTVPKINAILDLLDKDPRFSYTLDGQFGPVADYLSTLPEEQLEAAKQRIIEHVSSGRFKIGPLERAVDFLHITPEAMLRAFEDGISKSDALGGAMRIAYLPDQFGFNSSMPEILNHVGINYAVVIRGVPRSLPKTFIWEGSDGSEVTVFNLNRLGYNHKNLGIRDFRNHARKNKGEPSLLIAGSDQSIPSIDMVEAAHEAGVNTGSIDEYIAQAMKQIDPAKLPRYKGELRDVGFQFLLANTTGNRADNRKEFANAGALVEVAETAAALMLDDQTYPEKELKEIWELMHLMAAHDSINLTVSDEVAADIKKRVMEIIERASRIKNRSIETLASRMAEDGEYAWNQTNFEQDIWVQKDGKNWLAKNVAPLGYAKLEVAVPPKEKTPFIPQLRITQQREDGDTYTHNPKGPVSETTLPIAASKVPGESFTRLKIKVPPTRNKRLRLVIKLPEPATESIVDSGFGHAVRPTHKKVLQDRDRLNGNPATKYIITGGLAFLVDRAVEYEILPKSNEIAITLVRSHGALSKSNPKYRYLWAGPRKATEHTQVNELDWEIAAMPWTSDLRPDKEWGQFARPAITFHSDGGGYLSTRGELAKNLPKGIFSAILPRRNKDGQRSFIVRTFSDNDDHSITEEPLKKPGS